MSLLRAVTLGFQAYDDEIRRPLTSKLSISTTYRPHSHRHSPTHVSLLDYVTPTDGRLQVASADSIIRSQLVPPKPGLMRIGADATTDPPQHQLTKVAQLPEALPTKKRSSRRSFGLNHRRLPTARQAARWWQVPGFGTRWFETLSCGWVPPALLPESWRRS